MSFLATIRIATLLVASGLSLPPMAGPLEDAKAAFDRSDNETALRLWRDLAEQGNAEAQYRVGAMYWNGRGVSRDYGEAVRWYRKAAEQEFAPAEYDLGIASRDGLGMPKDDAEYARWNRKAAEQGFAPAQHNLASQYMNGSRGVARDDAEAARWYRKAAEQGWVMSQGALGVMYAQGRGVPKDLVGAYKWLTLSAQGAERPQREQLIRFRDELAKAMTPAQVEQAQQLARDWNPGDSVTYRFPSGTRLSEASTVAGGQLLDMGSFAVDAPLGDGWKVQTDPKNGVVVFTRTPQGAPPVTIGVQQRAVGPEADAQSEDQVIAAIQGSEEANLKERGAAKSYALGEVRKETANAGGKKLYLMSYVITDSSLRAPVEVKYVTYAYLSPNWKQTKRVYLFVLGQPQKIGESTRATDPTPIDAVISSFREK